MNWSGKQETFAPGNGAGQPDMRAMFAFNRPALEAMAEFSSRALEQIAAVNAEWTTFVQRRIAQDFELPQQLARCRSPEDVLRVCAEFTQTAVQQYQNEWAQIARMNQAFGNEAADIVRAKAEKASRQFNG